MQDSQSVHRASESHSHSSVVDHGEVFSNDSKLYHLAAYGGSELRRQRSYRPQYDDDPHLWHRLQSCLDEREMLEMSMNCRSKLLRDGKRDQKKHVTSAVPNWSGVHTRHFDNDDEEDRLLLRTTTNQIKHTFNAEVRRCSALVGSVQTQGRVHKLPKRLEDDYDVQTESVLGTGMSGAVVCGTAKEVSDRDEADDEENEEEHEPTRRRVAVKSIDFANLQQKDRERLLTEVSVFLMLDHPNVVPLHDVYIDEHSVHLVMACMSGGELISRDRVRAFSEHKARDAMWQMMLAIKYMHSKGVVHRDLKPQNFLYEDKHSRHLKLIDFGLSKFSIGKQSNQHMHSVCGSLRYMAPEVWSEDYGPSCDLWSMGVIVFRLLMGYLPFDLKCTEPSEWAKTVARCYYRLDSRRASVLSPESIDFIERLLVVEPEVRLTLPQAFAHPWLAAHAREKKTVDANLVYDLTHFASMPKFKRACYHLMVWSLPVHLRKKLRPVFLQIDGDHNGVVQMRELKQYLLQDWDMTDSDLKLIFNALDENGDGEIGWSEFLAAVAPRYVDGDKYLIKAAFKRFDKDGSGHIGFNELKSVLGGDAPAHGILGAMGKSSEDLVSFDEFLALIMSQDPIEGDLLHSPGRIVNKAESCPSRILGTGVGSVYDEWSASTRQMITKSPRTRAAPQESAWTSFWACCISRDERKSLTPR